VFSVWIFALLLAQDVLPPEMRQLVKIKQRMTTNLKEVPNYTCQVGIERYRRAPWKVQFEYFDHQQVEVALVGEDEWFNRPGAGRLETRDLRDLIPRGLVSSGDYANHARSVFISSAPTFDYVGMEQVAGRTAVRFKYNVSLLNSGYRITSGSLDAVVAYHGSIWADPSSGDLLRLDLFPDDIPLELGIAASGTTVDYASMRIGNADFLLPERTELTVTRRQGSAERNRMTFTQCRQYGTESAVSFGPTDTLPAGLTVTLGLDSLDLERARGGDPIFAKVVSEVRSQEQNLIPAGATVRGRVLQIDRRPGPPPQLRVALEFDEIMTAEHRFYFIAVVRSVTERRQVRRLLEPNTRLGVLSLIVQSPFRLSGLVSTWKTQ